MVSVRWRLAICTLVLWAVVGSVAGQCSDPPPRDPGILETELVGHQFPAGTSIMYTCRIGYHMASGNGQSTCVASNAGDNSFMWTSPTMACNPITCPEPKRIDNGKVIGTEYSFGKTVTFECYSGYMMWRDDDTPVVEGEVPVRECTADGSWNSFTPSCKPVKCPEPERNIIDGSVEISKTTFMGIITYSCNPGYQIKGNAERRCLANGAWSGKMPECIDIQCLEPEDEEFKENYPGVSAHLSLSVEPGHTAHFECKNNKSISVMSTCTNTGKLGEWVPPPPDECVTTPAPTGPDESTTLEPDPGTSAGPTSGDGDSSETPPAKDSPSDEGLPTWAVALLVVFPVSLVLGGVVAYLWKRSQRQHHRIPTKEEKNGAVDLPVMSTNAQQV